MAANLVHATSSADARNKAIIYRREYTQMGGKADFYNFEFWQKYPDTMGSENDGRFSSWNTIRDLMLDLLYSVR